MACTVRFRAADGNSRCDNALELVVSGQRAVDVIGSGDQRRQR